MKRLSVPLIRQLVESYQEKKPNTSAKRKARHLGRRLWVQKRRRNISLSLIAVSLFITSVFLAFIGVEIQTSETILPQSYESSWNIFEGDFKLKDKVDKYRDIQGFGTKLEPYQSPTSTDFFIAIDNVYDINEVDSTVQLAGRIRANWWDSSLQDYEGSRTTEERQKILGDILTATKLNFSYPDKQQFQRVWIHKDDVPDADGEFYRSAFYRFQGTFPITRDMRRFPFDSAHIEVRLTSQLPGPDLYLYTEFDGGLGAKSKRVDAYLLTKRDCQYSEDISEKLKAPQYECYSDDLEFLGGRKEETAELYEMEPHEKELLLKKQESSNEIQFEVSSAVSFYLERARASSFFRYIAPLLFAMIVMAITDQLSQDAWEIKVATPPTILLTLIFMHSGYQAEIPQLSYVNYMDKLYFLAYLLTIVMLSNAIISRQAYLQEYGPLKKRLINISRALRASFFIALSSFPFILFASS